MLVCSINSHINRNVLRRKVYRKERERERNHSPPVNNRRPHDDNLPVMFQRHREQRASAASAEVLLLGMSAHRAGGDGVYGFEVLGVVELEGWGGEAGCLFIHL